MSVCPRMSSIATTSSSMSASLILASFISLLTTDTAPRNLIVNCVSLLLCFTSHVYLPPFRTCPPSTLSSAVIWTSLLCQNSGDGESTLLGSESQENGYISPDYVYYGCARTRVADGADGVGCSGSSKDAPARSILACLMTPFVAEARVRGQRRNSIEGTHRLFRRS